GLRELVAVGLDPRRQLLRLRRPVRVLDSGVVVLGRLTDDHDVDMVEPGAHPGVGLAWTNLGVQVELVPQADGDRAEAASDRGRDRAFEGDPVSPDRLERGW